MAELLQIVNKWGEIKALSNTIKKGNEMADKRNNRLLNAKLNKYIVPGIMLSLIHI